MNERPFMLKQIKQPFVGHRTLEMATFLGQRRGRPQASLQRGVKDRSILYHRLRLSPCRPEVVLRPLERFARYSVHVTAFNAQGAGPASPDQSAFTLEDGR